MNWSAPERKAPSKNKLAFSEIGTGEKKRKGLLEESDHAIPRMDCDAGAGTATG